MLLYDINKESIENKINLNKYLLYVAKLLLKYGRLLIIKYPFSGIVAFVSETSPQVVFRMN